MIQLIAHLLGDFVFQTDEMAKNKPNFDFYGWWWCLLHCIIYALPFLTITQNFQPIFLIFFSHFIIDKFGIAKHWCQIFKVGARFDWNNWIKIYLIFMVDMAFHLGCNYIILSHFN